MFLLAYIDLVLAAIAWFLLARGYRLLAIPFVLTLAIIAVFAGVAAVAPLLFPDAYETHDDGPGR
jgi:hypothetical protein